MRSYTEKIEEFAGQFKEQMASLYKQGYKDGSTIYGESSLGATLAEKKGYAHGLSDAWECAKRIACYRLDGGLAEDELLTIFNTQFISQIFGMFSVSEAIAKIKEYDEQKNSDCSWCVNAYDEIIYTSVNEERDVRGVVIDINEDGMRIMNEQGRTRILSLDHPYRTTGRRFPEMKKILEQLQEGGANDKRRIN